MTHRHVRQISGWIAVLAFAAVVALFVHGWQARTIGPFKACIHSCHDGDCCDDDYADSRWWQPWLPIGAVALVGAAGLAVRARVRESR